MARIVVLLLHVLFREIRHGNPTVLAVVAILAGIGAGLAVVRAFRQEPEPLETSPAPGLDFADEPRPSQRDFQWQMPDGK